MRFSIPLASVAALLAALSPLQATQPLDVADPPGTARELLDSYVRIGLERNLTVAQATAAASRATAARREARARFLPSVGIDARYSELSGVIDVGDFINPAYDALNQLVGERRFPTNVSATLPFRQETRLVLVQPLFNDALRAARDLAQHREELAGAQRRTVMRDVAADIQRAWLAYASATRLLETLDGTLVLLDENLRVSERRVQAGTATPDAVHRARAERSEVRQQRADVARQQHVMQRAFNMLLDRAADAQIAIASDSTLLDFAASLPSQLDAQALDTREELQAADKGIALARAEVRIATSSFLPSVTLAASYGVQGDRYRFDRNSDVGIASLVLSWNLVNGGQDVARRQQAAWGRTEAEYRRRAVERAVRAQVGDALDGMTAARSSLTAADDRLESARRAYVLVERAYAEGLAAHVEYVAARTAYTSAALNQVITRYGYAARAVDLERAAALRPLPE